MRTKTAEAKKREIGVRDAAERLSQLNSGSQQSQNKDKPSKLSSGAYRLGERHRFVNKQKVVSSADMDKLKSVWNSMSLEKKKSLLKVSVSKLEEYLDSSKDDSVKEVLEALSFYQSHKTLKFWLCCSCNDKLPSPDSNIKNKFPDSESHIQHVRDHIGNLQQEHQQILPQKVDSHWAEMLLKCEWKPVEVSDAVKMIEDQSKGQDVVPVDSSDIGNHAGSSKEDSVMDDFCSKDTSDSCLGEGKIEPSHEESKGVDNGSIIENRDHDDISNVELMKFECNQWSNVHSLAQSWPLSSDSERIDLLTRIHGMFKMLLGHKYLATSELTKVIQYTTEKLQGLAPKSQLLNHCLSKTPLGICFLEASQLKEVLKQLQDYCKYGGFRFFDETHADESHADTQNSEVSERIILTDYFLHLLLDEQLLCNPGRYSEKSSCSETGATETSVLDGDCEGGVFADGDALLSSIFTGSTSAEQCVSWKRLKEEKTKKGMDVFDMLKKEFSNLEGFCKDKCTYLRYVKALEGIGCSESALREQKLVEKDEIKLDAISKVLKDAGSVIVFPEDQNDTSIKEIIQRMKDACSVKLSKIDASIMHNVAVRQQLELNLGSLSSHDYQTLILSSVKTFIQAQLEDLAEKGAREKSDAAEKALLAELVLEENKSLSKGGHHSKQIQEKSKNEKKKKKRKNKKKDSEVGGGIEPLVPYEETAEQGHDFPIASDQDSNQKIGAGRKPQLLSLAESDQQSSNSGDNYRNLGENDLGGVIFGCTDYTIGECLLNRIFGLPSQHFTYVKNIGLGLPLFLFNYSDRKLHGIYEAARSGKMNLNPHAWSGDGSETQFPAQVSLNILEECQPLPEELFKPIIRSNYYGENTSQKNYNGEDRFKFELDHAQARDLISLFKSSPTRGSTSIVSRVPKDAPIHESKDSLASILEVDTDAPSAYLEVESGFPHDAYKSKTIDPDPNARNEQGAKTVDFPFLDPSSISVNEENQMLESHSEKEEVTCPNVNGEEEGVVDVPHEKNDTALEGVVKSKNKNMKKKKDSKVAGSIEPLVPYEETAEQGMGADKKPQMLGEKNQQSSSSVDNYRNLRKKDLGGVIFGCTSVTTNPANFAFVTSEQFTYLKNMEPGLPLFLFDYSDRKLHGIFEATSQWKMNGDGSERTLCPPLFFIYIRMQCQPLPEERFSPIIDDNYSVKNPLWFELDHVQASRLISLFESSSPTMGSTSTVSTIPMDALIWTQPLLKSIPNHDKIHESKDSPASMSKLDTAAPSASYPKAIKYGFPHDVYKSKSVDPDPSNICVNEENQMLESHSEKNEVRESEEQPVFNKLQQLALERGCSKTCPNGNGEGVVDVPHEKSDTPLGNDCSPEAPLVSSSDHKYEHISINSSTLPSLVIQLTQEIRELKDLSVEQLQKTTSLEGKLMESEFRVQGELHQLKGLVKQLESQLSTSIRCVDEPLNNRNAINQTFREPFGELRLGVDELVFILGGYDGTSWLSSLDCYSPSRDIVKSLKPMSRARSFAASATLNGDIYIFGGGDDEDRSWYNTVESYNPLTNEWTSRPSLLEKKGSLAGATLHGKVYAIGGRNGIDNFSDVEMFDLSIGRWIPAQPMLQKRFGPAAAELTSAIYAVGGFDGYDYLKSAERFDPRETSWSRLESMNTRRASLSLAVLNEKLYALGGSVGDDEMVPTVEVFDPRIGRWMAGDEMKEARGYFASTVMGETIYAWGGIGQSNNMLDTVECYKEGQGWQLMNLKGVGKRGLHCCCSLSWLQP